jgi:CHASE2 domain-containing sensor protein
MSSAASGGPTGAVRATNGPYVGLDYFLEEDADLFFGRDAERKRIIGNLRASRLTLLYAASGVGKSSLLRAGVAARLRQLAASSATERDSARYVPVVFSAWGGNSKAAWIAALEAAVRPLLREDARLTLRRDALEHAIEDVAAAVDATLLVILDQFEDHFLYEPRDEQGFDDELARCINRRDLRANFLISVREDAYSLIGHRFKASIPNVYGNYLHLDFLDERAARVAVLEPVNAFNKRLARGARPFEVETALVDAVLEQVRRGRVTIGEGGTSDVGATGRTRVETAYLQLVMKRLWDEELAAGSRRLRLETLRRLGGADTIVRAHLDDAMAKLPAEQRDAAAAAFRFLLTSSGRKIALSTGELRELSEAAAAPLEAALKHLERQRILRPVPPSEPGGVARCEIYHDVLAPAILDWRRRHIEKRRRRETERRLAQARERTRRLEVRNRRLAAAVLALVAVVVALAVYLWDPGPVQRLELGTVDARFSVRGARSPDPRLVLVAVDDKTLERFDRVGVGQLSRDIYARMLDRLRQHRPAVIALDVIFRGSKNPRVDRALLDAIRATHDRLVLAFDDFSLVTELDGSHTVRPELLGRPAALRATGVRTGFAGVPEDRDERNRRADYEVNTTADVTADTFAFAAADVAQGGELRAEELPAAPRRAHGEQSERTTWIDFRGPPGTVPRVSAADVLEGRVAAGAFRDKRVVVGLTAPLSADVQRTPLDGGRGMPGPELQANALDTMLRGSPMRDAPRLVDILAILLLAAVPAAATLVRRRHLAIVAALAAPALFLVIVQLAFGAGLIIAVVAPLAGLLAASLGAAGLTATRVVRARAATRGRSSGRENRPVT